jgi:hypothetical protein
VEQRLNAQVKPAHWLVLPLWEQPAGLVQQEFTALKCWLWQVVVAVDDTPVVVAVVVE